MIRTKISAIAGVTYGLLSALVIITSLGALAAAGVALKIYFQP